MRRVVARQDPDLSARVVSRAQLLYTRGEDPGLDRPAHVRAGSSLARAGDRLLVVQDDANFVAVVDPESLSVEVITLPAGPGDLRLFDDLRGNKAGKLDLEACAVVPAAWSGRGDLLLAFGSGSTRAREKIALITGWEGSLPEVRLVDASRLYESLRSTEEFSGSELNVEGAVFLDGVLRLFGRGNGAPRNGVQPVDASCDLNWSDLSAYLENPQPIVPVPSNVVQYDLGVVDGLRLGFTDAAVFGGGLVYSAAAEDSPDVTRDGFVAGSVLGLLAADGSARWAPLRGPRGEPWVGKVEGIAVGGESWLWAVLDSDSSTAPSELCRVELEGPWFRE